jgi:hypothetical protein
VHVEPPGHVQNPIITNVKVVLIITGTSKSPCKLGPVARYGHENGAHAEEFVKPVPGVVSPERQATHCVLAEETPV